MPVFLVYFALLAVAFFFLIVRPQRRQLAARRALIKAVEVGDEIITAGGIYGVVRSIDEEQDTMRVEIAPGVEMTLAREAVARRRDDTPPADSIDLADPADATDPTDATSED
jgi:preprotein translocase subunit YajC